MRSRDSSFFGQRPGVCRRTAHRLALTSLVTWSLGCSDSLTRQDGPDDAAIDVTDGTDGARAEGGLASPDATRTDAIATDSDTRDGDGSTKQDAATDGSDSRDAGKSEDAAAPVLNATTDHSDEVALTWSETPGASAYAIVRDGVRLTTVPGTTLAFLDETADAPSTPLASVTNLVASAATTALGVELRWSAPPGLEGRHAEYRVDALGTGGTLMAASNVVGGWRRLHLAFEVRRDLGNYVDVGTSTTYLDAEAPGSFEAPEKEGY